MPSLLFFALLFVAFFPPAQGLEIVVEPVPAAHVLPGCTFRGVVSATTKNATLYNDLSVAWISRASLPYEFNLTCTGTSFQYDPALPFQACQGSLHYEFQPKPSQVGRTYRAEIFWVARNGSQWNVTSVYFPISVSVVRPNISFQSVEQTSFLFNIGCTSSFKVYANLTNSVGQLGGCGQYPIQISPIAAGSYPPSPTGLPVGFPSPEDNRIIIGQAQVTALQPGSTDLSLHAVQFDWTPAWSQEMAAPYRICFQASAGGSQAVQCYSAIVQKCSYCAEEGDTIQKLAIALDTDWLHLYTLNPVIKNPDYLPKGQLVNLGVIYQVKEGDTLFGLYSRFLITEKQFLIVNPDLKPTQELVVGQQLCIIPPVCGVQCSHGLDCTPVKL